MIEQPFEVANCLTQRMHKGINTTVDEGQTPVVSAVAPTLRAGGNQTGGDRPYSTDVDTCDSLVAHSLRADGFDAGEDGTGRGTPLVPVAFPIDTRNVSRSDASTGVGTPSTGVGKDGDPAFPVTEVTQAVAFQPRFARNDRGAPSEIAYPLTAEAGRTGKGDRAQCVAFAQNSRDEVRLLDGDGQIVGALAAEPGMKQTTYISTGWAVRRLLPIECCRLQGFPDDYLSQVTWRGQCPPADGPMYKALGNSWAVNVFRWVGRRIEMVEQIAAEIEKERAA